MEIGIIDREFSICKLESAEEVDFGIEFTFFAKTDNEISLVTPLDSVPPCIKERDDGWRAMRIVGQLDFSLIGILSRIATLLAEAEIPVFVLSTFDTDYILVKKENLDKAVEALEANGYIVA